MSGNSLFLSAFIVGVLPIILPFGSVHGINVKQNYITSITISKHWYQEKISIAEDKVKSKQDTVISESKGIEIEQPYLDFSRTLLDSLLITNPGYSKLILIEIVKNLKDTVYIRQEWERRLNESIHKYLLENYPEGSENAINQYTGPGINIPIDDLIDVIKGVF